MPVGENVLEKATSGRRGLWALMSWGPEKMLIRCRKESHHPAEWPLGFRLSSPGERERHNADGHNIWVKIFQLCSVSSSLSHVNLEQPLRTLAIKWEVNILLKKSSSVCHYHCVFVIACVCLIIVSLWYGTWEFNPIIATCHHLHLPSHEIMWNWGDVSAALSTNTEYNGKKDKLIYYMRTFNILGPVGWGSRIHWLHHQGMSRIWQLASDGEVPLLLEIWGIWSASSLPLLPGPLWCGVVASDRVLSMDQIELNHIITLNWIVWN